MIRGSDVLEFAPSRTGRWDQRHAAAVEGLRGARGFFCTLAREGGCLRVRFGSDDQSQAEIVVALREGARLLAEYADRVEQEWGSG